MKKINVIVTILFSTILFISCGSKKSTDTTITIQDNTDYSSEYETSNSTNLSGTTTLSESEIARILDEYQKLVNDLQQLSNKMSKGKCSAADLKRYEDLIDKIDAIEDRLDNVKDECFTTSLLSKYDKLSNQFDNLDEMLDKYEDMFDDLDDKVSKALDDDDLDW